MDVKKSFKADLRNKRGLLLEIGAVAALVMVIVAFSYTPGEYRIKQADLSYAPVEVDMIAVTRPEEPKQTRVVTLQPLSQIIQIMDNKEQIDTNLDLSIFESSDPIEFVLPQKEEQIEDEIFVVAEKMPMFDGGGLEKFRAWVLQTVKFPQVALENNIYGRVTLSFVVDKDGRVINIEVLQSPDRSLAEEAVRVLNKSPKWTPGKQRNQTVRVKFTLPVDFRVAN